MASGLVEFLRELAEPLGDVHFRRMFGGWGLFGPAGMFGLVIGETLYFKVDADGAALFDAEGLEPFSYARKDRGVVLTSYRRAPERVFDDPDEFAAWARRAMAAAASGAAGASGAAPARVRRGGRARGR